MLSTHLYGSIIITREVWTSSEVKIWDIELYACCGRALRIFSVLLCPSFGRQWEVWPLPQTMSSCGQSRLFTNSLLSSAESTSNLASILTCESFVLVVAMLALQLFVDPVQYFVECWNTNWPLVKFLPSNIILRCHAWSGRHTRHTYLHL